MLYVHYIIEKHVRLKYFSYYNHSRFILMWV